MRAVRLTETNEVAPVRSVEIKSEGHQAAAALGDTGAARSSLGRAHILSPPRLQIYLGVHWTMLKKAISVRD